MTRENGKIADSCMIEKTVKRDVKFEGRIIKVRVDTVELPDGTRSTREIVEHPGGVCVISIDGDGGVLMVRQFRQPFGEILLEVPAGKLNYDENPLMCGMREFTEETGYTAEKYTFLGEIYPSVGFLSEILYIYLAENLTKTEQNLDEDEFLSVEKYQLSDLVNMVLKNEIKDAKTIAAILLLNAKINS
jgi:ADP-ribose pyrophosphatase